MSGKLTYMRTLLHKIKPLGRAQLRPRALLRTAMGGHSLPCPAQAVQHSIMHLLVLRQNFAMGVPVGANVAECPYTVGGHIVIQMHIAILRKELGIVGQAQSFGEASHNITLRVGCGGF